jgi:hypothetical protein
VKGRKEKKEENKPMRKVKLLVATFGRNANHKIWIDIEQDRIRHWNETRLVHNNKESK